VQRKLGGLALCCAVGAAIVLPAVASARTKTVYAGGPTAFATKLQNKYGAGANAFLLQKVTINAGDTVVWNGARLADGFHDVDFPASGGSDQPLLLPTGTTVSGVNDNNGNPFWFNGQPNVGFNPQVAAPSGGNTYDGTTRVVSGLPLGPPADFKVKFTRPGTYKYFCDVHYGMSGEVVVRPAGKPVPSAKRDANALKAQEKRFAAEAKGLQHTHPGKDTVSLGASRGDGLEVFKMFPATLKVKKDTVVTFMMSKQTRETHTATFGDTSPNGFVTTLAKTAFTSNPIDPIGAYPSDVPMPIAVTSTSHGYTDGFSNSGALDRDADTPPVPPSAQLKFTQAGTFNYICLIHPFMHGTVIVH
jgi:plastocyanin